MLIEFLVWFIGEPFLSDMRKSFMASIADDKMPHAFLGWGVWTVIRGKME
jgi:hypothetical protein